MGWRTKADRDIVRSGDLGRAAHHQVSHGVVAVEQSGGGLLTDDADFGPRVDASALNALDVLGEAEDAVTLRAPSIGFRNEGSDAAGVRRRKADCFQNPSNKLIELGNRRTTLH